MNEVKLVGKVAYVGQLKESAKGKKYLSFSLGTNNAGKMMWHSVMAWDKVAEYIYKILLDEPKKLLFLIIIKRINLKMLSLWQMSFIHLALLMNKIV